MKHETGRFGLALETVVNNLKRNATEKGQIKFLSHYVTAIRLK